MKNLFVLPAVLAASFSFAADPKPKPYPLTTCIISGEKLGSMGKPAVLVVEGQEVRFCCKGCIKDFNKDAQKHLKEIAAKAERR